LDPVGVLSGQIGAGVWVEDVDCAAKGAPTQEIRVKVEGIVEIGRRFPGESDDERGLDQEAPFDRGVEHGQFPGKIDALADPVGRRCVAVRHDLYVRRDRPVSTGCLGKRP
jgi:hypothetical protein